jgi:hypothetical protein
MDARQRSERCAATAMSALTPLPGRECGACHVCCVELGIDAPQLDKPDGMVCPHLKPGFGCAIYHDRPDVCRSWYCGWRLIGLNDDLRPDLCGLLLMPEMTDVAPYKGKGGLRMVLLDEKKDSVLTNGEIVDLAGQCIVRGLPLFLSYGNGIFCKRILMNEIASKMVAGGDRKAFVALLQTTMTQMIAMVHEEMAAAESA